MVQNSEKYKRLSGENSPSLMYLIHPLPLCTINITGFSVILQIYLGELTNLYINATLLFFMPSWYPMV